MVIVTDIDKLRKPTKLVKDGDNINQCVDDLFREMREFNAAGLSANQLGYSYRIFVMEMVVGTPICIVNPVIVKTRGRYKSDEGCLSIPGIIVRVERPMQIRVKGVNQYFKPVNYRFRGIEARRAYHEIDHLLGKLITDYKE